MTTVAILRLTHLPMAELQPLLEEARSQGFPFLDTLVDEYASGRNQFARPGEALFGAYYDEALIAIGGLNRDPYLPDDNIGRVRHLYVLSGWRRQGVGKLLMERIMAEADGRYRLLTLRTFDEPAARFYEALGFQTRPVIESASHHWVLASRKT